MTSPKERLNVAPPKRKTRASDLVIRHLTGTTLVCSPVVFTTSRLTSIQLGSYLTFVSVLLRKEVIQPHLPVRLPCYDLTPITDPTLNGSLLAVRPPVSGVTNFRGLTGGVYKARERIHPGSADPGLLATPTSCRRVAACNLN